MSTDCVVRARIDGHLKAEAASVLSSMGLSLSDAIRLLLIRIVADKGIPFDIKAPHKEAE